MKHPALHLALLVIASAAFLSAAGCSKRATAGRAGSSAEPAGPIEPLSIAREDLSTANDVKVHVRLIVPEDATRGQIDDLIRRTVARERLEDGELWISVFLEGMDVNSLEYAFGISRPGQPVSISFRESLQTYR